MNRRKQSVRPPLSVVRPHKADRRAARRPGKVASAPAGPYWADAGSTPTVRQKYGTTCHDRHRERKEARTHAPTGRSLHRLKSVPHPAHNPLGRTTTKASAALPASCGTGTVRRSHTYRGHMPEPREPLRRQTGLRVFPPAPSGFYATVPLRSSRRRPVPIRVRKPSTDRPARRDKAFRRAPPTPPA